MGERKEAVSSCRYCYYYKFTKETKSVITLPKCNTLKQVWVNPMVKNMNGDCGDFKKLLWRDKIERWKLLHFGGSNA